MPASPTADDRRDALEALLRQRKASERLVAEVMAAARAWVKAAGRESATPKAPAGRKPPAVHFAVPRATGVFAACREYQPGTRWALDDDPAEVDCGHCRKTPAWREAAGAS